MTVAFMLGTARKDITPKHPVLLAGFSHRVGNMEGVVRPLYLRIMAMQTQNEIGKSSSALIVSADVIWWGSERMSRIYNIIKDRWGIEPSAVILHATHTHSGPQTSDRFVNSIGEINEQYVHLLEEALFEGIEEAFGNMELVTMEHGTGECRIGINRRKKENDQIVMAPNEAGPVDPGVNVVRFITEDSRQKAVIVHFACHPTTTDANLISSEFPGVAMEYLERGLGSESTVLFMQGCCGDVRPRLVKEDQFYRGDDFDVTKLGIELAIQVFQVLDGSMCSLQPSTISSKSVTVPLPIQKLPEPSDLLITEDDSPLIQEWKYVLLNDRDRLQTTVPFQLNIVQLAEELSFLAMNGEVVTEYGIYVKKQFGGKVLPIAYSNGMIGYIPTAQQVMEGGYEANESHYYFGLPSQFSSLLEGEIKNHMGHLVQN